MAQRYQGRVFSIELGGGTCPSSSKVLAHLLDRTSGVKSYYIDQENKTLIAYMDDSHDDADVVVRALVASGMFPVNAVEMGLNQEDGTDVC